MFICLLYFYNFIVWYFTIKLMIPESRVILTLEKGVRFIIGSISIQIQQIMSIIPSGFVISARSIIVCKLWIGKKKA